MGQVGEQAVEFVGEHLGYAATEAAGHVATHAAGHVVSHVAGQVATHAAGHAAGHGLLYAATHAATHGVVGVVFGATVATALVHTALVSLPLIALRYAIKYKVGVYCESVKDEKYESLALKYMCGFSNAEDEELAAKARREMIELNKSTYVEIWKKSGFADNNDFENFIHDSPEVVQAWNSEFDKTAYHDGPYYFSTGHFMVNSPFIALHDELYVSQDPETQRKWKKQEEDYKAQQENLKAKKFLAIDAYNHVDHDYNFDIEKNRREAVEIREKQREAQFGKRPETGELDHPGWDQGHWC